MHCQTNTFRENTKSREVLGNQVAMNSKGFFCSSKWADECQPDIVVQCGQYCHRLIGCLWEIKANPQVGRQGQWRQLEAAPSGGVS